MYMQFILDLVDYKTNQNIKLDYKIIKRLQK